MNISQRGANTDILKILQQKSHQISESTGGVVKPIQTYGNNSVQSIPQPVQVNKEQMSSIQQMFGSSTQCTSDTKIDNSNINNISQNGVLHFDFSKSQLDRSMDAIESLSVTKEYINAIQSIITLYAIGSLDDDILDKISDEDAKEIRDVLKDLLIMLTR